MTTITIKVPVKAKDKLSALVKELGGEIISITPDKSSKKVKMLDEIRMGLKDVKEIQKGNSKSYQISDLIRGN